MAELPRGTVTLLFTDIEGSTRLLQELGRDRYVRALNDHRRLLREAFTRHGGVEVEMQGDSFFFAFRHARDAVLAADEARQALAGHAWESESILVRIGIHTGEPVVNGDLYAGLDVHRAARVMSTAHGGQVVVSEQTHALVDGAGELIDLGLHRLKDLTEPVKLYQLGAGEFPPLKTLDATNLPVASSPLVGREREVAELLEMLNDGSRLVTVTGPGGTGKTRLALQVAGELVGSFSDGVFWVPLAGLADPELVLPTIAQTIGARDDLGDHLRAKRLLLLVDNVEHLLPAAGTLAHLLAAASEARLLVTSRGPLHVAGEVDYPLEPLQPADAMTLFVERARAAGRQIDADATAEEICRRLDGLPLAIELAAARVTLLSPASLLERLDRALPLLTHGMRDAPERQRTLRATIDWSHDLLDDEAKSLFARLGVFAGTFSIDAAEAICGATIDTLYELVDQGLLKAPGEARLLMLETIREYALERQQETADAAAVGQRHAQYFLRLAEEAAPELERANDREWLDRLELERENFRAALAWARATGSSDVELRLVSALRLFWSTRGPIGEFRHSLEAALAHAGDDLPEQRADALQLAALEAYFAGDFDQAEAYGRQMLEIAQGLGDRMREISALTKLGGAAAGRDDVQSARELMERALTLARELGDRARLARSLANVASVALLEGDYDRAAELCEESLAVGEHELDSSGVAGALLNLAEARVGLGQHAQATDAAKQALHLAADRQDSRLVAAAFSLLAAAAPADCAHDAARLLGAAANLRDDAGDVLSPSETRIEAQIVENLRAVLGNAAFDAAWTGGRELTLSAAVDVALAVPEETPQRSR